MATDYKYSEDDFFFKLDPEHTYKSCSKFDLELRSLWDSAMSAGHFRYSLDGHTRVRQVPGQYNYLLQLNTLRGVARRKPEDIQDVKAKFDPDKFNFTKVKSQEVLMYMTCNGQRHPVLINVSPLDYGHVLFVPEIEASLPQCLTETAISVGIHAILLSSHRGMLVGFNGLCAFASVNHLHLHAWYIDRPVHTQSVEVKPVCGCLSVCTSLPIPALVLHVTNIPHIARCIHSITDHLTDHQVAHNLAMVRLLDSTQDGGTVRVYIWPRKSVVGSKNEVLVPFNAAVAELTGQIPFYIPDLFDSYTEEDIMTRIQEHRLDNGVLEDIVEQLTQKYRHLFENS